MQTEGSEECQNHRNGVEMHEDVQSGGNRVAEVGLEYFCLDYVSKNGVSVTERNISPAYIQFCKVSGLGVEIWLIMSGTRGSG